MTKRRIVVALGVLTIVLIIGVLTIGALGYILFSRKGGDTEIVFAPTEVGTPEGPKVTVRYVRFGEANENFSLDNHYFLCIDRAFSYWRPATAGVAGRTRPSRMRLQ